MQNIYVLFLLVMMQHVPSLVGQTTSDTDWEQYYDWWNLKQGDSAFVFSTTALIRTKPDLNAAIIDTLKEGHLLLVQSLHKPLTVAKGFKTPWILASYTVNGQLKTGYIWQGLLSIRYNLSADGNLYLAGKHWASTKRNKDMEVAYDWMGIKVISSDTLLMAKEWAVDYGEQSYIESKLLGHQGLQNCQQIYRIGFIGEACGITTYYYYFALNEGQLYALPSKEHMGDAGIYYYEEQLLFPTEHKGANDIIIKNTEEANNDEEKYDKEGSPVYKIKKASFRYKWNGRQYIKM